jgi:hypothetical protein
MDKELLPCPIKKVYERFKHLDVLFSDPTWLNDDDKLHDSLFEMWQAIKDFNTRKPSGSEIGVELKELIINYICDVESGLKYLEQNKQDYGLGKSRLRNKAEAISQVINARK